jgi:hypothetical protein
MVKDLNNSLKIKDDINIMNSYKSKNIGNDVIRLKSHNE